MTLLLNERERIWEYRDNRMLVLSFHWDREKVQYVTDRGELLGSAWPGALKEAESLAQKRADGAKKR